MVSDSVLIAGGKTELMSAFIVSYILQEVSTMQFSMYGCDFERKKTAWKFKNSNDIMILGVVHRVVHGPGVSILLIP